MTANLDFKERKLWLEGENEDIDLSQYFNKIESWAEEACKDSGYVSHDHGDSQFNISSQVVKEYMRNNLNDLVRRLGL